MGAKYEIIICWSDEDKAFVSEVPELPGCMTDGQTYQEALSNAEQVIQEWIETAKEFGRGSTSATGSASLCMMPTRCFAVEIT